MPMMLLRISSGVLLVVWLALIGLVHCNVEKTIFIATHAKNIESWLSDIELPRLSPNNPTIRARLPVTAPNDTVKADIVHWFLLDDLEAGTRYEVRICWPATQPTDWKFDTLDIATIEADTGLRRSIVGYDWSFGASAIKDQAKQVSSGHERSMLFLKVTGDADYFTVQQELMKQAEPVLVDIILDQYILNIFPQSLIWTAIYITAMSVVAWIVSRKIWKGLTSAYPSKVKEHEQ